MILSFLIVCFHVVVIIRCESVLVYNSASPILNDVLKAGWRRRGLYLDTESAGNYAAW